MARYWESVPAEADSRVVVAVSGGRDSVALTAALGQVAQPDRLHLAHVHHHLRGPDADEDADLVVDLARKMGLRHTILHVDVPAYRLRNRLSTLAAARYARYQALGCLAASLGGAVLAAAHTLDDQIETVLMNVLRGCYARGVTGMQPRTVLRRPALGPALDSACPTTWTELRLDRPLLTVPRESTGAYCRSRSYQFRDDPSNRNTRYRRPWIRDELSPALRAASAYFEDAVLALSRSATETMSFVADFIDRAQPPLYERIEDGVSVNLEGLAHLAPLLRPYVLTAALRAPQSDASNLEQAHLDALLRLASTAGPRREAHLPNGTIALREGRSLSLTYSRGRPTDTPTSFDLPLSIPGAVNLPDGRRMRALIAQPPSSPKSEANAAWLDLEAVGSRVRVRSVCQGDRYRALGTPGSKPLNRVFIDRKVPRAERVRALALVSERGIAWVAGLPVAEFARVRPGVSQSLRVEITDAPAAAP